MTIPTFTFAAYSNMGKTTYLEGLIPLLKRAGLRVALIKHDAHDFQMDRPGKDTWRFGQAGADVVMIASAGRYAMLEYRPASLERILEHVRDVDIILTEGFKREGYPKIALYRSEAGEPLAIPAEECFAIVTDTPMEAPCPVFPLEDPRPLAAYLISAVRKEKEAGNVDNG